MTLKHTPGPWQVNINNIGGNKSITVRSQLNAAGVSRQIAEVNPYVNPFSEGYTAEDNARLIAAAPELLEACANALQYLLPLQSTVLPKSAATTVALVLIDKAIKKAKGA